MTKEDLDKVLENHKLWIHGKEGGQRANLSGENLRCADLRDANLKGANLRCANLSNADLRNADFTNAKLMQILEVQTLISRVCHYGVVVYQLTLTINS